MKYVIVLLFNLLFFSCSTLKPIEYNPNRQISPVYDVDKFNGKYSITSENKNSGNLDVHLLVGGSYFDFKNPPDSNDYIFLQPISENKIKITIYDDEKIVKEKTLKGKLERRYFHFKRQHQVPLFTLALNVYRSQKARIALLENGNLLIDSSKVLLYLCSFQL